MRVELSGGAQDDLDWIERYIGELGHSPNQAIARRTADRVLQALGILEHFPHAGRPGRVGGTRELNISTAPYFAVYRFVADDHIVVTAIVHDRQQYPPMDDA
ncbi:MAG: type II toxin-antitoxin system RelE/ParE family toxin [Phyllobacteriaceae bacterium]|nr:type II toxin-antitoxin system RelE/ParE family toxin [Phyllobacteriaceae bacterium]